MEVIKFELLHELEGGETEIFWFSLGGKDILEIYTFSSEPSKVESLVSIMSFDDYIKTNNFEIIEDSIAKEMENSFEKPSLMAELGLEYGEFEVHVNEELFREERGIIFEFRGMLFKFDMLNDKSIKLNRI